MWGGIIFSVNGAIDGYRKRRVNQRETKWKVTKIKTLF
jgi:hypothetical protein